MVLYFNNTQRTPSDSKGSGLVNISIIAPYCDQNNPTLLNPMLIKALQPFDHLQFMSVLGTNYQADYYGDTGNHIISWDQRSFPNDSVAIEWSDLRPGKHGWPWEYVASFAS